MHKYVQQYSVFNIIHTFSFVRRYLFQIPTIRNLCNIGYVNVFPHIHHAVMTEDFLVAVAFITSRFSRSSAL